MKACLIGRLYSRSLPGRRRVALQQKFRAPRFRLQVCDGGDDYVRMYECTLVVYEEGQVFALHILK
jgi:hypothetical protein